MPWPGEGMVPGGMFIGHMLMEVLSHLTIKGSAFKGRRQQLTTWTPTGYHRWLLVESAWPFLEGIHSGESMLLASVSP